MMSKLTEQQVNIAYDLAREVRLGKFEKSSAIRKLCDEFAFNKASAFDYIHNLGKMLDGEIYHRTLNIYATEYFLDHIAIDFGAQALQKALIAVEKHLDYYDSLGHGKQVKIRSMLKAYRAKQPSAATFPDEVDEGLSLKEGAVMQVTINAYERNPRARRMCLEVYGHKCIVCEFDFESHYGDIGREFIHVHHLQELSTIRAEYEVDPIRDLRPVCPNCHAMLHRRKNPAFTIDELKERLHRSD